MARTNFSFQKRQKELAKKKKKEEKMQRKLEKKNRPADDSEMIAGPDEVGAMTGTRQDDDPAGEQDGGQGSDTADPAPE